MKRVFVGIPIAKELGEEVLRWRNITPLPPLPRLRRTSNPPLARGEINKNSPPYEGGDRGGLRWLSPKNLHVTLVPPWYQDDIQDVIDRLQKVHGQPFAISFNQITFGPNPKAPRLIWAKGKASAELSDLKLSVEQILNTAINDGRHLLQYQPHITLARFRAEDFGKFKARHLDEKISWHQKVESFALYESHLSPQGADYEILAEFKL
jgi:2'-5' RNA ligase